MMFSVAFRKSSVVQRGLICLVSAALIAQPAFAYGGEGPHSEGPETPSASDAFLAGAGEGGGQPLQIDILDGEGALNNIRARTAREPIVQVTDKNHKPVAGALVIFAIQPGSKSGHGLIHHAPSASFHGAKTIRVRTDENGKATAHGLTPNGQAGSFVIQVTAVSGGMTATTLIHEQNVIGSGGNASIPHHFLGPHTSLFTWTALGGVAAGTIATTVVLLNNGSNAISITPGTGTVGKP